MTIDDGVGSTWGDRASRTYSNAKQYGGTALLWTFFAVLVLTVGTITVASNWHSLTRFKETWLPTQTSVGSTSTSDADGKANLDATPRANP